MSVGIIGSGTLGLNLARAMAKNGLSAIIGNRRGPDSLKDLVQELGETITAALSRKPCKRTSSSWQFPGLHSRMC